MSLAGTGMTAVATVREVATATDLPRPILGGGGVGIKVFFCREILQYIALLFHFHGHFLHYSQHHLQNDDHFPFFPSPLPSNNLKSHSVFLLNPSLFRTLSRHSSGLNRRLRHMKLVRSFQGGLSRES